MKKIILLTLCLVSLNSFAVTNMGFCNTDWELRKIASIILSENPSITLNQFGQSKIGKAIKVMYKANSDTMIAAYFKDGKNLIKNPKDIEAAKAQCVLNLASK